MENAVLVSDILGPENMKKKHSIPLDTLVEVDCPCSDQHGIRAWVVEHTRDCDQTPLYAIGLQKSQELNAIKQFNHSLYRFMIEDGFTQENLKIVGDTK